MLKVDQSGGESREMEERNRMIEKEREKSEEMDRGLRGGIN